MATKKPLYKYMREREAHALEVSKQVGELQRKFAQTNVSLMGDAEMIDKKDDVLIEAAKLIDDSEKLIAKRDYLEERALDSMQACLELQQRLDAVNGGGDVVIKVRVQPRPPELIMAEAQQLNNRLAELKIEFAEWESRQPVETAH